MINQHLQQFQAPVMMGIPGVELPSQSSSWETGYGSGLDNVAGTFSSNPRTRYNPPEATYLHRDEVETEIF